MPRLTVSNSLKLHYFLRVVQDFQEHRINFLTLEFFYNFRRSIKKEHTRKNVVESGIWPTTLGSQNTPQ
jgi:hypothetical protein